MIAGQAGARLGLTRWHSAAFHSCWVSCRWCCAASRWSGRWGEAWAKSWLIAASLVFYAARGTDVPAVAGSVGRRQFRAAAGDVPVKPSGQMGGGRGGAESRRCWAGSSIWIRNPLLGSVSSPSPRSAACCITPAGTCRRRGRAITRCTPLSFRRCWPVRSSIRGRCCRSSPAPTDGGLTWTIWPRGGGFFVVGLLKKTLLADPLATLVGPGFADPAALDPVPGLAGRHCLFPATLFRFFRLHRHGDRPGLDGRPAVSGQFRSAVSGCFGDRLLAALAYVADPVPHDDRSCAADAGGPALAEGAWPAHRRGLTGDAGRVFHDDRNADRGDHGADLALAWRHAAVPAVRAGCMRDSCWSTTRGA